MISYFTILRPLNCFMSIIAVFIGALLVSDIQTIVFSSSFYIAMFAAFVITGAGNVINDYIDIDSDKINARNRPMASGKISKQSGLYYVIFLFVVGIASTLFADNFYLLGIALFNSILLILYAFYFQNKILIGNIVVSYLVGSTFLFGGAAFGNLVLPLFLMLLAMLSNITREIVKDLEDLEGDRKGFLKRLVLNVKEKIAERFEIVGGETRLKYSRKKATVTGQVALLLVIILSPIPYMINLLGLSYLILVLITDIIFIYCIVLMSKASKKKQYRKISKRIKLGMFFGLLAFVAGILF